jgi:hypothetical protein
LLEQGFVSVFEAALGRLDVGVDQVWLWKNDAATMCSDQTEYNKNKVTNNLDIERK